MCLVWSLGWSGLTERSFPNFQFIAQGRVYVDEDTGFLYRCVVCEWGAGANRLACGAKQHVPLHTQYEIGQA